MITIRPAQSSDLDAVWLLVGHAVAHMNAIGNPQWGEDYPTRAHYEGDIARGELYAAISGNGTLLGVACLNQCESPEYACVPWSYTGAVLSVHRMAVDPQVQRQGVATKLFSFAEDLAYQQGLAALHVDTYSLNHRMQALFHQRGYNQRGEIFLHGRPLPYPCFEKQLERGT